MGRRLGSRWYPIGPNQWQHEETGRIVQGDDLGPFVDDALNWREACEIEHAARMDLEVEINRLRLTLQSLISAAEHGDPRVVREAIRLAEIVLGKENGQ
jgi:hypothetical protein